MNRHSGTVPRPWGDPEGESGTVSVIVSMMGLRLAVGGEAGSDGVPGCC
jgi:hypothetical protein